MEEQTLNRHELERVFAILEKEQPDARDRLVFRLWSLSVFCWAIVYVILEALRWLMLSTEGILSKIADIIAEYVALGALEAWLGVMSKVLGIASVILFLLSLPLVLKLWRQGRAARRMHLSAKLQSLHRQQRRRYWIFMLVLFILVAASWNSLRYDYKPLDPDNLLVFIDLFAAPAMLCTYLIAMYFVRRGREQFDVIRLLQRSPQERTEVENVTTDHGINIAESDYNQIAVLERRQIIRDRRLSIQRSKQQPDDGTYVVQKSHELLEAMDQLDSATRIRVEDRIFELVSQQTPEKLATGADNGCLRLRVPETQLEITYQVDSAANRIKIYSLEATNTSGANALPKEE
jgi:hypothetical protein